MRLSDNLSDFMYKQAISEEEVAQIVEALQEAEKDKKKKKKGPNYGKRFLRGAAFGAPYGGLLGAGLGASSVADYRRRLGGEGPTTLEGGLLGGGAGLGNMLGAYLQGDLYDAIAAGK